MERFLGSRTVPISVLVCPLDGVNGADGGEAAETVLVALRRCPGMRARAVPGSPSAGPRGGAGLVTLLHHATRRGRTWLQHADADVLIWGQRAGSLMRLAVLDRRAPLDPVAGRPHPWTVVALPVDMPRAALSLLHATVLVAAGPEPDPAQRTRDCRLRAVLSSAEALVGPMSGALFAGEVPAAYRLALGRLRAFVADRTHDPAGLRAAADTMDDALATLTTRWPADLVTLGRMDWADAHLRAPAPHDQTPRVALRAGLDAYQAGLALLAPNRLPMDTAPVRVRAATALHRLARETGESTNRLAAIEALEAAAQTWVRAGAAHRGRTLWAAIAAMRLEEAIAAHDGTAFADIVALVDAVIADFGITDTGLIDTGIILPGTIAEAATLARLHHARATALAGLAWHRPAAGLREQAAASLGQALTLYRRLGMGNDLLRARRLLARLRATAWNPGRADPLPVTEPAVETTPRLEPVPISPVESRPLPRRDDAPAPSSCPLAETSMSPLSPAPRRAVGGRIRRRPRPRPSDNRA